MKQLVVVALSVLLLAGCSTAPENSAAPKPDPSSPSTSVPSPSPTAMSVAEAGAFYLKSVCPTNTAITAVNNAFDAQNLAAIQAASASARDLSQTEARTFDDARILWPTGVAEDVKVLRDGNLSAAAGFDAMAKAGTLDAANGISIGDQSAAAAASQRIRLHLNLPADTSQGC